MLWPHVVLTILIRDHGLARLLRQKRPAAGHWSSFTRNDLRPLWFFWPNRASDGVTFTHADSSQTPQPNVAASIGVPIS